MTFCWNQFDENSLKFSGTDIFPIHTSYHQGFWHEEQTYLSIPPSLATTILLQFCFCFFPSSVKTWISPDLYMNDSTHAHIFKVLCFWGIFFSSLYVLHYLSIVLFESMFLLHPKTSSISLEIIFYAWLMVCQNWFVWKLTPYSCVFQNLSLYIAYL